MRPHSTCHCIRVLLCRDTAVYWHLGRCRFKACHCDSRVLVASPRRHSSRCLTVFPAGCRAHGGRLPGGLAHHPSCQRGRRQAPALRHDSCGAAAACGCSAPPGQGRCGRKSNVAQWRIQQGVWAFSRLRPHPFRAQQLDCIRLRAWRQAILLSARNHSTHHMLQSCSHMAVMCYLFCVLRVAWPHATEVQIFTAWVVYMQYFSLIAMPLSAETNLRSDLLQ